MAKAAAHSSESELLEPIVIYLASDDDDDSCRQLQGDMSAEITKLRRTVSEQEEFIDEFLKNQVDQDAIDKLTSENEELRRSIEEIVVENDNLKHKLESMQKHVDENETLKQNMEKMKTEIGEYEGLLNDFLEHQAKEETYVPQDPCAICQEEFQSVRTLTCRHSFHSDCIRKWLHEQESCPVCRSSTEDNS